jgi:hypothetical protein
LYFVRLRIAVFARFIVKRFRAFSCAASIINEEAALQVHT